MILVDTSVLLDYLKNIENEKCKIFQDILERKILYCITNYIFLEVLQGAKTDKEFDMLKDYLGSLPFYDLTEGKISFEKVAKLNLQCRGAGVTVRSTIDLILVQIALEHDLALLHNDRDFDNIASVISKLIICKTPDLHG
jgi:predicted nucleic acid-binding protein